MIPKIIHFIWIGQKPQYLNMVLKAYKNKNKDCKINLIYYSIKQLEDLYFNKKIKSELDNHVYNLIYNIYNNNGYYKLIQILMSGEEHINYSTTPFLQIFCDILRLEILNIYGGIYVDCDTFPIKPFDDMIFNNDKFCVYDKINDILIPNNYFLGLSKNIKWENYFDKTGFKFIQLNNQQFTKIYKNKSFDFMIRRIKFFKSKLTDIDFKDLQTTDYFEHYSEFRWGNNMVLKTKFDTLFNRNVYLLNS